MNVFGPLSIMTGVPAPPAPIGAPVAPLTAPVASAPAWAVQQSAHAGQGSATSGWRGLDPNRAGQQERMKEARLAWMVGRPGKAPAVWPMFPSSDADEEGRSSSNLTRVKSLIQRRADQAGGGTATGEMIEAVKVVRGDTPDAATVVLGTA